MARQAFTEALAKAKIPILVLDQKWHRLFALEGKPQQVVTLENELNNILARQGALNQELKELKRVKASLMKNIVDNMDDTETSGDTERGRKMEEDRRLIDEVNQKIEQNEDELLEIPREIQRCNDALMMETMNFCYDRIRVNYRRLLTGLRRSEWNSRKI